MAVVNFLWHVGHWKCLVRWCWMRIVSSSYVLSGPQYQLLTHTATKGHHTAQYMANTPRKPVHRQQKNPKK